MSCTLRVLAKKARMPASNGCKLVMSGARSRKSSSTPAISAVRGTSSKIAFVASAQFGSSSRAICTSVCAASSAVSMGFRARSLPCRRVAVATITSNPHSKLRRRDISWTRCSIQVSSASTGSPKTTRSRIVSTVSLPSRTLVFCTLKVGLRAVSMRRSTFPPKSEGGTITSSARPLASQASYMRLSCSICSSSVPRTFNSMSMPNCSPVTLYSSSRKRCPVLRRT